MKRSDKGETTLTAATITEVTPVYLLVMPAFGAIVSISAKYCRRERTGQHGGHYKYWESVPFAADGCLFLGTRILQNGFKEYDHEYGWSFDPHERIKAALVCPGPLRKPVLVPLDAVKA